MTWNLAKLSFCSAQTLSPCSTCTSTRSWLSITVVKFFRTVVGMLLLRGIRGEKTSPESSSLTEPRPPHPDPAMSDNLNIEGSLSETTVPDLFRMLIRGSETAIVSLQQSGRKDHVYFRDGAIVFAWSTNYNN